MGGIYQVTCARSAWPWSSVLKRPPRWVPVTGEPHSDRDAVGYSPVHWHVDYRFLDLEELAGFLGSQMPPGSTAAETAAVAGQMALETPMAEVAPLPPDGQEEVLMAPDEAERTEVTRDRYLRVMPMRYLRHVPEGFERNFPWLEQLTRELAERRLGADMKCPHRGADLTSIPAGPGGDVTCPFHGMRWDLRTGRPVRPLPTRELEPWRGADRAVGRLDGHIYQLASDILEAERRDDEDSLRQLFETHGRRDTIIALNVLTAYRWLYRALPHHQLGPAGAISGKINGQINGQINGEGE